MRNQVWFMFLVLGLVAAVAGAGLAAVNGMTEPVIENAILKEKVAPTLKEFFEPIGVVDGYIEERVELDLGKNDWGQKLTSKAFLGKDGSGKILSVALQTEKAGFGGAIKVLTVFDLENKKLLGVKTLDQSETVGLGSRVANDAEPFIQQFVGMSYEGGVGLKANGGQVDAISGATVSSGAFTEAVNNAVKLLGERADELTK